MYRVFLASFVSGKGISPPQLHPSRIPGLQLFPPLGFCSLTQKLRDFYGAGKYLGPEKPGPVGSFTCTVL